jgi:hypothetical protein
VYYQRTRHEETGVFDRGSILSLVVGGTPFSVFGDRDLDELDVACRGTLTFTRTLSLQFYSQVLLARGRYMNYRRLVAPATFRNDIVPPGTYDFNEVILNANVLLRWEYLPGSTLFLVWTQGRYDDTKNYLSSLGERFGDAFRLPHEDVLLLKVNYWFSF